MSAQAGAAAREVSLGVARRAPVEAGRPPWHAAPRAAAAVTLALLAALGASACGKTQLSTTRPHAQVSPLTVDFGKTPLRFAARRTLVLGNGGSAALHLTAATLTGAGSTLFNAGALPGPLQPGDAATLEVTFTPLAAGPATATLLLASDDPEQPEIEVALFGEGTVSGTLLVAPAALDFGRVGEGQTVSRELLLQSQGTGDLFLADLSFSTSTPAAYGFIGSARAPATLPSGTNVRLAVRFSPRPETTGGKGALQLASSDPEHGLLVVPLTSSINRAPVPLARGGILQDPPQPATLTVAAGATVNLDASGSTDPDGDLPLHYTWSLPLRPDLSRAAIADTGATQTQLVLDQPGLYSVLLAAQDATGLPGLFQSRLDLHAVPPLQLVVELVWDQERPDLDLHLLQQGATVGSNGDCGWTNPDPVWFPGGYGNNPHLLSDKLVGYGPETVQWKTPAVGSYGLSVVYKSANGLNPAGVTARVRVTAFGIVVAELSKALSTPGEVWNAGTVAWPTGRVTGSMP